MNKDIAEYRWILYAALIIGITLWLFISDFGSWLVFTMEIPVSILFFISSVMMVLGGEGYFKVRKSKYVGIAYHSLSILMFIIGFIGATIALSILTIIILPSTGSCGG